jgi:hypothetical protein
MESIGFFSTFGLSFLYIIWLKYIRLKRGNDYYRFSLFFHFIFIVLFIQMLIIIYYQIDLIVLAYNDELKHYKTIEYTYFNCILKYNSGKYINTPECNDLKLTDYPFYQNIYETILHKNTEAIKNVKIYLTNSLEYKIYLIFFIIFIINIFFMCYNFIQKWRLNKTKS